MHLLSEFKRAERFRDEIQILFRDKILAENVRRITADKKKSGIRLEIFYLLV